MNPSNQNRWWASKDSSNLAGQVTSTLKGIRTAQFARLHQYTINRALYNDTKVSPQSSFQATFSEYLASATQTRLTYNIIAVAGETIISRITKNRVRPWFITSGANYKTRRLSKKLTKYCDGLFSQIDADRLGAHVFRDAVEFGTGCAHVFIGDGEVKAERVSIDEIFVEQDQLKPRRLYRVKEADKALVEEQFDCTIDSEDETVELIEAWNLPVSKKIPGKHVIVCGDQVLVDEKWHSDFFPFIFIRWSELSDSFYGVSLTEQLMSIQLQMNLHLYTITQGLKATGQVKIFIPTGAEINKESLGPRNAGVGVVRGTTPPQYIVPPSVPPEVYNELQSLERRALKRAGVSEMAAQGLKSPGLNSGAAIMAQADLEADRFQTVSKAHQDFFIDLARLCLEVTKQAAQENGDMSVRSVSGSFLYDVKFSELDIEDRQYEIKCMPVNALPSDPAGRIQTVTQYLQSGFINQRQARRLMALPDLEAEESSIQAKEDIINRALDSIIDEGVYMAPDPLWDLQLARELALDQYSEALVTEVEEEKLELLRTFIQQVSDMASQTQPQQPPPAMEPQQVSALTNILKELGTGAISPTQAQAAISAAFPMMNPALVQAMTQPPAPPMPGLMPPQ